MFFAATLALLAAMMLMLVRLFLGPSLYDRVLALNAFGTKTVLLIGLVGFVGNRPDFMDIALLYALINFVSTIAVLKFFRYRALGDIPEGVDPEDARDLIGLEKPGSKAKSEAST
ncbi:monovalent cation/H+ antiporter complex subunit F [Pyruvatibacter sp.]|uniref:monovalent cation/H+ antiporter complex subunit F n=1 Tax=Pyruvatibacter sp. TaxID=1981328 RepID=UPI0032EFDA03